MAGVFHLMNPSLRQAPWVTALTTFGRDLSQWALIDRQNPHHTETLLDWALKANIGRLVVWGGDGTFHRVVRGLWQRDALDRVELALVPAGTCNDLARYYGLAKESWGRWEASAPQGRLAALSLGRVASASGCAADAKGAAAETDGGSETSSPPTRNALRAPVASSSTTRSVPVSPAGKWNE